MRKCSLSNLSAVFDKISENLALYIPVDTNGGAKFEKYESGMVMSEALNTVRSAKDFFFPQIEDVAAFKVEGKNIEVVDTRVIKDDFVIFGARACDVKAFEVLDNVFLSDPVDSYYANRREHGIIFALSCSKPVETCFCNAFGIDCTEPKGDVSMWKTESEMYFKANSEKGEKILALVADLLTDGEEKVVESEKAKTKEVLKKLPLSNLSPDKFGGGKTKEYFDDPAWKSLSESCLGCGTCTFVCPTCQCYDVKDFNTGHGVVRFRCWDSCMYSDFTKMAHGNPRLTQLERFRQRFMHKLVYYPENNNGLFMCVGCGRCLAKCPISMNIVKVMKTLGGKN
ncbi:MAG: 4Fe-4S dicluster domain-containing protein [Clostridia bacterium]|nr:4Fe-4S dicluster domain-containing protein [Clostridia bacterium]